MTNLTRRDFLKLSGILGAGLAGAGLAGCGSSSGANASSGSAVEKPTQTDSPSNVTDGASGASGAGKVLVAYYSAQGHTKRVAEAAADELGADLFEIVPEEVYTDADLTWANSGSRVCREHDDESLRDVPLANATPDGWADYDTVLLGYPIWWAIAAWPTDHFATDNDFTGKKVIPFCTSSSSGLEQSGQLLAQAAGTGDWQCGTGDCPPFHVLLHGSGGNRDLAFSRLGARKVNAHLDQPTHVAQQSVSHDEVDFVRGAVVLKTSS